MLFGKNQEFQLTYCTNIHPGNSWDEVFTNLRKYVPALKQHFSANKPFGIGLRLSDGESRTLLEDEYLEEFKKFLREKDLYVFTINGFPFGDFHSKVVKSEVFAPDWQNRARVEYTVNLAGILSKLLSEGSEGSISTSPLSYKAWMKVNNNDAWHRFVDNIVEVVVYLVKLREQEQKLIHIDFEPEPNGVIENSLEVVEFFEKWLLGRGTDSLATALNITKEQAKDKLLDHVRVCYDTCHSAVEFEDPLDVLARFSRLGIKVGKLQISSALKVLFSADITEQSILREKLKLFCEPVYLHQVVERKIDGRLTHYADLDEALASPMSSEPCEWRIHFHVPLFLDTFGELSSTQNETMSVLKVLQEQAFTKHLEVETYTWDVLPKEFKMELSDSIAREFAWVHEQFNQ